MITTSSEYSESNRTKSYGLSVYVCTVVYCTRKICTVMLIFIGLSVVLLQNKLILLYYKLVSVLLKTMFARLFCRCYTNDEYRKGKFTILEERQKLMWNTATSHQHFFYTYSESLVLLSLWCSSL